MAINLAEKYSGSVDEVFRAGSLTTAMAGGKYDFVGARTVKVYSMGTAKMNDYDPNGTNRYGTPEELQDTTEELTLSQKRSFTFTIDATNAADSPAGVRDAAQALRRQLDKVVIPEIDTYRLKVAADRASTRSVSATSAATAYSDFLEVNGALSDAEVPAEGRIAYVSNAFANAIKKCDGYTKATEIAQNMLINGQIGDVDGVKIVLVPKNRMPAGASFIIVHSETENSPEKLAEYKIHDNPPGIAGHLVEGLIYYDAFITENKRASAGVHFGAMGTVDLAMKADATGKGKLVIARNAAGKLMYKTDSSVTVPDFGKAATGYTEVPADGIISATAGNKVAVVSVVDGKVVAASAVITAVVGA